MRQHCNETISTSKNIVKYCQLTQRLNLNRAQSILNWKLHWADGNVTCNWYLLRQLEIQLICQHLATLWNCWKSPSICREFPTSLNKVIVGYKFLNERNEGASSHARGFKSLIFGQNQRSFFCFRTWDFNADTVLLRDFMLFFIWIYDFSASVHCLNWK